jgi:Flp pilus assembly protein TadD
VRPHAAIALSGLSIVAALLGGCASLADPGGEARAAHTLDADDTASVALLRQSVLVALKEGRVQAALSDARTLAEVRPTEAESHFLLALALHASDQPEALAHAAAGYRIAGRYAGRTFWPAYLAGVLALDRDQPGEAVGHFAEAVIAEPTSTDALLGLAVAAYRDGDLVRATEAASRVHAVDPDNALGWQVLALARAGAGDRRASDVLLARAPAALSVATREAVAQRAEVLLATTSVDAVNSTPESFAEDRGTAAQQVMVDVTLILADDRRANRYGLNLLDGLRSQFSIDWKRNGTVTAGTRVSERTLTEAITLNVLNYNLNIFNRAGRYYEVLARPSLTAFLGEESSVFIGETSNVAVGGVNVATLEKIEIGISLKITPLEIRGDGARVRIQAERGFFSDQNPGTFAEQITVFQQRVAATADLRFGETLILSGLTEQVADGQSSRTPVLGDVPVLDTLFSQRSHIDRRRSAIVLVTPSVPMTAQTSAERNAALAELSALWSQAVAPRTDWQRSISHLRNLPLFTRGRALDTALPQDFTSQALNRAVRAMEAGESI